MIYYIFFFLILEVAYLWTLECVLVRAGVYRNCVKAQ